MKCKICLKRVPKYDIQTCKYCDTEFCIKCYSVEKHECKMYNLCKNYEKTKLKNELEEYKNDENSIHNYKPL